MAFSLLFIVFSSTPGKSDIAHRFQGYVYYSKDQNNQWSTVANAEVTVYKEITGDWIYQGAAYTNSSGFYIFNLQGETLQGNYKLIARKMIGSQPYIGLTYSYYSGSGTAYASIYMFKGDL
ncbi:MAG TPA: hypothetical protein ENH53_07110 [Bacteroidetes bacterium]|nr:hypothetical protein [Bacteroidota bacterium]